MMVGEINESSQLITGGQEVPTKGLGQSEVNGSKLQDKIEMMRQSITQLSVLSRGKNMDSVRRLEQQQESSANFIEQEQRRLLLELNDLEATIEQIERARMVQSARLNNHHIAQDHAIRNHQEESREESRRNRERFEEYRDQITDLKVQLAEVEVVCKQRMGRFERECQGRMDNCVKNIEIYVQESEKGKLSQHFREAKALRNAIDEQGKFQQRELSRMGSQLAQLRQLISSRCQEEQRRQKQGFGQNYRALQELFLLLSQQYGVQR